MERAKSIKKEEAAERRTPRHARPAARRCGALTPRCRPLASVVLGWDAGAAPEERGAQLGQAAARRSAQPARARGRGHFTPPIHTPSGVATLTPSPFTGKWALPLAIVLTAITTATVVLAGGAAAVKARPAGAAVSAAPRTQASASSAPPFRFLAIGDWGRKGVLNQTAVAAAMARRAAEAAEAGSPVGVIISTGDNFYPW